MTLLAPPSTSRGAGAPQAHPASEKPSETPSRASRVWSAVWPALVGIPLGLAIGALGLLAGLQLFLWSVTR